MAVISVGERIKDKHPADQPAASDTDVHDRLNADVQLGAWYHDVGVWDAVGIF